MARLRLSKDLAGATCPTLPWQKPENNVGYLEIVEGQYSDKNSTGLALDLTTSLVPSSQNFDPNNVGNVTDAMGLGDYDDILALTVRSDDEPFVGRAGTTTIESTFAEVIWYAVENPVSGSLGEPGMRTVYRRVLLIAPWIDPIVMANDPNAFFTQYDISAHYDTVLGAWVPNTLGDLTKRENRFAHDPTNFPHRFPHIAGTFAIAGPGSSLEPLAGDRQGEDVMLSDVLAFDVRVFDPGAPLRQVPPPPTVNGTILEPSDAGWLSASPTAVGSGTYVDLSYLDEPPIVSGPPLPSPIPSPTSLFSSQPSNFRGFQLRDLANGIRAVYDTWSFHYETIGGGRGTNGLDDDGTNGVDDIGERETAPPYDVPLRGIQVKLRVYERDTRQIREATVTRNFVPN